MEQFTPNKSSDNYTLYRDILMRGDGIKADGGASSFYEVIPRYEFSRANPVLMRNIAYDRNDTYERIAKDRDAFKKVINTLKEEDYVVSKMECELSGIAQYHASVVYLEGESK